MSVIRVKKSTLAIDTDWGDSGSADFLSFPDTFSIDHFSGASTADTGTLSFTLKPASKQLPMMYEPDFVSVVRQKIDITTVGPDKQDATDADYDVGKHDYKGRLPRQRKQLPLGVSELKGEEL